jgi:hypothetical protein
MPHQRRIRLYHFDVRLLEHHFLSGTLSARLLTGLLGPANHDTLPESVEAIHEDRPETVAICDQQCDRRDTPHDAQHGKRAARAVALQGDPGFVDDFE